MKRYRLVEANTGLYESDAAVEEKITKSIKHTLAPIKDRTFTLNWDEIEERLGGPVSYKVKIAVEKECGSLTFTGTKVFAVLAAASTALVGLFGANLLFAILLFKELLVSLLIFCISFSIFVIFAFVHKKRIEEIDINECVGSAKRGEIDSNALLNAVNTAALNDIARNKTLMAFVALAMLALVIVITF